MDRSFAYLVLVIKNAFQAVIQKITNRQIRNTDYQNRLRGSLLWGFHVLRSARIHMAREALREFRVFSMMRELRAGAHASRKNS